MTNTMTVAALVAHGAPEQAFEMQQRPIPVPADDQLLIKIEGFGLNYADVMARIGIYPDCPDLPAVLGYEVVGRVERVGAAVSDLKPGQRVVALTRFGGYAEYAIAQEHGAAAIPDHIPTGKALALATQYCTAFYCAEEMLRLHAGDHVLVHAAAGGVGTALVQLARRRDCIIYGTASEHKLGYLSETGVHHPINYRKVDFVREIRQLVGERGLDVIFDPIGGKSTRRGLKLLGSGGRIVMFGASRMSDAKGVFSKLSVASSFGLYHPISLMKESKSILGVNMLRIGDNRPWVLQRVLSEVIRLATAGELDPHVGKTFSFSKIAEAHEFLASRQSIGKVACLVDS